MTGAVERRKGCANIRMDWAIFRVLDCDLDRQLDCSGIFRWRSAKCTMRRIRYHRISVVC